MGSAIRLDLKQYNKMRQENPGLPEIEPVGSSVILIPPDAAKTEQLSDVETLTEASLRLLAAYLLGWRDCAEGVLPSSRRGF